MEAIAVHAICNSDSHAWLLRVIESPMKANQWMLLVHKGQAAANLIVIAIGAIQSGLTRPSQRASFARDLRVQRNLSPLRLTQLGAVQAIAVLLAVATHIAPSFGRIPRWLVAKLRVIIGAGLTRIGRKAKFVFARPCKQRTHNQVSLSADPAL